MRIIKINDAVAINGDHIWKIDYFPPDSTIGLPTSRVEVHFVNGISLEYFGDEAMLLWKILVDEQGDQKAMQTGIQ